MTIEWLGHSCFKLTACDGTVLVTDPFDASVGYPCPVCDADIVTESHQHHDHNDISSLSRVDTVLKDACAEKLGPFTVKTLDTYHDDENGAKRGSNLIFIIEADGCRIAHLGDLGHYPDDKTLEALKGLDYMLIPVGGFFTIDAETAEKIRLAVRPRHTIPMHFLTDCMKFPIKDEKPFLALNNGQYMHTAKIDTADDIPEVAVLDHP